MTAFLVSHFPFTSYYGRKKIIFPLCRDREEGKGKVIDKTPAKKATVEAWPQTGRKTMDSHKVVSRDGIQDSTGTKRAAGTFPLPSPHWRSSRQSASLPSRLQPRDTDGDRSTAHTPASTVGHTPLPKASRSRE